jgi:hypothetical protein
MQRNYRIFGRVQRMARGRFRALASAVPDESGAGPSVADMRGRVLPSRSAADEALGLLAHAVARRVMARGDRVTRIDVR